jgi:hypothetical protein
MAGLCGVFVALVSGVLVLAVSKIVRVIRQPKGNMLLIGIGGSGRQSLTRLASFICEYTTFQIEVSKHYRRLEFRDGECNQGIHSHCKQIMVIRVIAYSKTIKVQSTKLI